MEEISAIFHITGPNLERDQVIVPRSGIYAGRTQNNDLWLEHSQISRQHLRIFWQDGAFWVEDLGSTNGVWLNDARIEANVPVRLSLGDMIGAGPYVLILEQVIAPSVLATNGSVSEPQEAVPLTSLPEIIIRPGVIEMPATPRPRLARAIAPPGDALVPKAKRRDIRRLSGIPEDRSNWLQYLPGIFSDPSLDPTEFVGRYLLVFESLLSPIIWIIDNFDLYLSPETAPDIWMEWMASWFDITVLPELQIEQQRQIMRQIGWLFLRRGTRAGLERMLELCFGVRPEITENDNENYHFLVQLPLSRASSALDPEIAHRIIQSQKPAFTTYTLEIT